MFEPTNILIIDDDDVDRMTLMRALKKSEIETEVCEVTSGEEGVEVSQQQYFDCIFLDYQLPDNNGLEVLRTLRAAGVDSPIVMLTGQSDMRLAVEMMKTGASDYLSKEDLTPEILSRIVNQLIRLHNAEFDKKRAVEKQELLLKELQDAQEQLVQSEKMASIGQLAAGVAHEINNPVGYIYSNIGTLDEYISGLFELVDAYEQAESKISDVNLKTIILDIKEKLDLEFLKGDIKSLIIESQEGVTRVQQIVKDLKDFSHVDTPDWQWVDLHKGISSTLNIVNNEIKYKAEVIKQYGELPEVECFPSQLNQVFLNLFVNAAHAIEERGTIIVRTGQEKEEVWVEFVDTGKGIAEDQLSKIFDPFYTSKPIGEGTGLGLSLSYGIVKKHGGRIDVNSKEGEGTSFKVWLPVRQSEVKTKD